MDRVAGQPEQVESLTTTLAGVGEPGVLSLMEDMSGSQLLLKCLGRFTADQNQVMHACDSCFNPSIHMF
jgi:hypothetical protein